MGGFLYSTIASVGIGVALSGLRWLTVDQVIAWTGVRRPSWDDSLLATRLDGYVQLVEEHYRYYQAYANALVAFVLAIAVNSEWLTSLDRWGVAVGVAGVLFASSRDTLKKCYSRLSQLLDQQQGDDMTNGGPQHHPDPKASKEKAKGKDEKTDKKPADQNG